MADYRDAREAAFRRANALEAQLEDANDALAAKEHELSEAHAALVRREQQQDDEKKRTAETGRQAEAKLDSTYEATAALQVLREQALADHRATLKIPLAYEQCPNELCALCLAS